MPRTNSMQRVTIRLPKNHPALNCPNLSERIRQLVDAGLQIQSINDQLRQINARLDRLESLLESGATPKEKPLKTEKAPNIIFDLDAFANEL
ncbi:MAG: hypothetical protein K6T65_14620 [Peptococcaceae bacterium]|nr:hypothetical protein [Peptococcaceae bacterium]